MSNGRSPRSAEGARLGLAVSDVRSLAKLLHGEFLGEPLYDSSETEVRAFLRGLAERPDGQEPPDSLVMHWAGHTTVEGSQLTLRTARRNEAIPAAEVVRDCVKCGAGQVLLIIDACYSGAGVADIVRVVETRRNELATQHERTWLGIIVSCREIEKAEDGGTRPTTAKADVQRTGRPGLAPSLVQAQSADLRRRPGAGGAGGMG